MFSGLLSVWNLTIYLNDENNHVVKAYGVLTAVLETPCLYAVPHIRNVEEAAT